MPTDAAVSNRDFEKLFSISVRYEIPFFQRGYAWEQRQWKKLFEDIETEIIENVDDEQFEEEEHFFGPIVVLEKISPHHALKHFLVIDGQQRITTVYLLLSVIRQLMSAKAHDSSDAQKYVEEIGNLLVNKGVDGDDYLKLKVYSTKGDRYPTYKGVFQANPSSSFLVEDMELYNPDENKVDAFIKYATRRLKNLDVLELWKRYKALVKSLKIVWIPLDEKKDDAQAIFESLNDAGIPLAASELLCNYIFRPLIDDETKIHEKLHNEKWLVARKEVGANEFEEYLRDLFSIGEKKRIGKARRMYVHFKGNNKRLSADSAKATLEKIVSHTTAYNNISSPVEMPHPDNKIREMLISINDTNMITCRTFLMSLLKSHEEGNISLEDTLSLLRETYVLLVRRKVTGLPTTQYDTFFPSLLAKIAREPSKVAAFHDQVLSERLWVSDQEFEGAFAIRELYRPKELNFSRLILKEIDKQMHDFGEFPDYSTIDTIEHVMPQGLDTLWKDYLGEDVNDPNLKVVTNTLGNLCLNSQSLNSHNGQKLFGDKKFPPTSALARDLEGRRDRWWNLDSIRQRSRDLAKHALKVWKWSD